jgi:hypothetical protein
LDQNLSHQSIMSSPSAHFEFLPWASWMSASTPTITNAASNNDVTCANVLPSPLPLQPLASPYQSKASAAVSVTRTIVNKMVKKLTPIVDTRRFRVLGAVLLGLCTVVTVSLVMNHQRSDNTNRPLEDINPNKTSDDSESINYVNIIRNAVIRHLGLVLIPSPESPQSDALDWIARDDWEILRGLPPSRRRNVDANVLEAMIAKASTSRIKQRYALAVLHFATGRWDHYSGWTDMAGSRVHECLWRGVYCPKRIIHRNKTNNLDETEEIVTELVIDSSVALTVRGTLPPELGGLVNLGKLLQRVIQTQLIDKNGPQYLAFHSLYKCKSSATRAS